MSSMSPSVGRNALADDVALIARLAGPNATTDHGQLGRELALDHCALTDLVHEALIESQRKRDADSRTLWGDAAEAANLILHHVAALTRSGSEQSDSESEIPVNGGVSDDHA